MTSIYLGVQTRFHHRRWAKVTGWCQMKCPELDKYCYKCFRHRTTRIEAAFIKKIGGLAFIFEDSKKKVTRILLYEHSKQHMKITQLDIYVYFYGCDPRPLLVCFCGCAYAPQTKEGYCTQWCKVDEIKLDSCVCGCSGSSRRPDDKLLGALTKVVGFLNTVNLYNHPNGTSTSKGQTCPTQPGTAAPAATQCQPDGDTTTATNTCTYTVHQFQGQSINVKVECCPVNGSQSCYRKLTHTPAGMNGVVPNTGFRLGNVAYCPNSGSGRTGSIKYYQNGTDSQQNCNLATQNKWAPLKSVTAYYYTEDRDYCDPLLVVLVFDVNGLDSSNANKEYYKLTSSNGKNLTWEKDDTAKPLVGGDNGELVTHLDAIRYCLKYTIRIHLECRTGQYPLMGRNGKEGKGDFSKTINGQSSGNGTVQVCEVVPCHKLNEAKYKCFKHGLTSLGPEYLHQIGGVKLYTRGREPGKEAEIKLKNGQAKPEAIEPVYYNKCMGDIYVYFYGCDPRPLLFFYNKQAYCAKTMEGYDKQEWYKDETIKKCDCTKPQPCECKLLKALVRVSDFLNPVKLHIAPSKAKRYTIHRFNGLLIWVKTEVKRATDSFCYVRYTHKHFGVGCGGDGFRLGDIYHGKNCIKLNGVSEKNGNNGKCISASDIDNKDNKHRASSEVVVFYYKGDTKHEHPLLVAMRKPGSCIYYSPYFELQKKVEPGQTKLYKKNDNGKDLKLGDTSPDGELAKTLDAILYRISKYLRVVLSQRPQPAKYSEGSDDKKCTVKGLENGNGNLDPYRTCKFNLAEDLAKDNEDALLYQVGEKIRYNDTHLYKLSD